jgi:hypothetical protein
MGQQGAEIVVIPPAFEKFLEDVGHSGFACVSFAPLVAHQRFFIDTAEPQRVAEGSALGNGEDGGGWLFCWVIALSVNTVICP